MMGELVELGAGGTGEARAIVRVAIKRLLAAVNAPGTTVEVVVLRRDLELVLAAVMHREDRKPLAPNMHPEQR